MKQFTFLLALLLVCATGLTAQDAPSPREIGDSYIENTGGEAAWLAIKAMKMNGKASMQGMEFPVVITNAEGNKQYVEIDVQGQKIIQAFDGETAWQVMPFMGITEPTPMSDEESEAMKSTRFLSEFINTKERGFTLTAVEGKELEGTPTYGVQITHEDGYDVTYYFDQEYLIPIMTSMAVKAGPQKGALVETYLSDYQEVGDVLMPMFIEVKFDGNSVQKITVKDAEINPEISDDMFSLPEKQ